VFENSLSEASTTYRQLSGAFSFPRAPVAEVGPTPDHTVREEQDPRYHTDAEWGRNQIEQAVREVVDQIRQEWFSNL